MNARPQLLEGPCVARIVNRLDPQDLQGVREAGCPGLAQSETEHLAIRCQSLHAALLSCWSTAGGPSDPRAEHGACASCANVSRQGTFEHTGGDLACVEQLFGQFSRQPALAVVV